MYLSLSLTLMKALIFKRTQYGPTHFICNVAPCCLWSTTHSKSHNVSGFAELISAHIRRLSEVTFLRLIDAGRKVDQPAKPFISPFCCVYLRCYIMFQVVLQITLMCFDSTSKVKKYLALY